MCLKKITIVSIFKIWLGFDSKSLKLDHDMKTNHFESLSIRPGGGVTLILGHIREVRPEWVIFEAQKPVNGCKFLPKNLRIGHYFNT